MKKLMMTAMIAGSMMMATDVTGAEATTKATPKADAMVAAPAVTKPAKRQITPEQRKEMRAKFEQRMASRKAEMEKKAIEVIKKYGLDEEKAKALLAELEATLKPSRRPRPNMKRPVPSAAPAKAE